MQHTMATQALSSAESIREIALQVMRMSEGIHQALRQHTSTTSANPSTTSAYALLTEEYALRARASMLLIEAKRLARPDFPVSQEAVLATLTQVETKLAQSSLDELSELITGLLLFTSSIISRHNPVISMLLQHLQQPLTTA